MDGKEASERLSALFKSPKWKVTEPSAAQIQTPNPILCAQWIPAQGRK